MTDQDWRKEQQRIKEYRTLIESTNAKVSWLYFCWLNNMLNGPIDQRASIRSRYFGIDVQALTMES